MEPWQESLENAKQQLKIADHMSYVALTILKENRLLIKIISSLAKSVLDLIKAFLYYEYSLKRVKLYKDSHMNFKTFRERIAPKYMKKDDFENLAKILEINQKHKKTAVEFVKKDKFVIFLGDSYETLDVSRIRDFLVHVKKILAVFPEKGY